MTTSTTNLLDRAPPFDHEAEKAVLGSLLLDQDKLDDVALVLRAEDFHTVAHQVIFSALMDLRTRGKGFDVMILTSTLKRAGSIQEVGGVGYLTDVADSVPSPANAVWYAEQVKDCSLLRSLIHAGLEMISEAHRGDGTARERVAKAEAQVLTLLEHGVNRSVRPIADVLQHALAEIDERTKRGTVSGVCTGYVQLDQMMGGMRPGELIVVAARPSHGKSALAANIVEYVSVYGGHTSLLVSLEMTSQELGERMLASIAHVPGHALRSGFLRPEDRTRIVEASAVLSRAPLFIDDSPQRNMMEIASMARRMKRLNSLSLLIVDYLQLIEPDNRRDSREQQVSVISRRLKQLARELKIPVVCLAQLNRESEKVADHIPKLSHLRESGAIEQDADVVLFVHREDMYRMPSQWDNEALIVVAKNRNGQRGHVKLCWQPSYTRFDNPASEWKAADHAYQGDGF